MIPITGPGGIVPAMANLSDEYGTAEAPSSAEAVPSLSPAALTALVQTQPWVRLFAILAFLLTGLSLLVLIVTTGILATGDKAKPSGFLMLIPLTALIAGYIPPAIFLWRYAEGLQHLRRGGGEAALERALKNQKSFWKYVGILACVMAALYALLFLFGFSAGLLKNR